jgi:hypothetical protein
MTQQSYDHLWHYTEQFSRDPLQRSELLTMAWKGGEKLGERCTLGLMKSHMHFRSKELNRRSAFPAKEVGKRTIDAWNHEIVYLNHPAHHTLSDLLLSMRITPLDYAIVSDFRDALTEEELVFLEDLIAGFKMKEIANRNHIEYSRLSSLRNALQKKAVAYL